MRKGLLLIAALALALPMVFSAPLPAQQKCPGKPSFLDRSLCTFCDPGGACGKCEFSCGFKPVVEG